LRLFAESSELPAQSDTGKRLVEIGADPGVGRRGPGRSAASASLLNGHDALGNPSCRRDAWIRAPRRWPTAGPIKRFRAPPTLAVLADLPVVFRPPGLAGVGTRGRGEAPHGGTEKRVPATGSDIFVWEKNSPGSASSPRPSRMNSSPRPAPDGRGIRKFLRHRTGRKDCPDRRGAGREFSSIGRRGRPSGRRPGGRSAVPAP